MTLKIEVRVRVDIFPDTCRKCTPKRYKLLAGAKREIARKIEERARQVVREVIHDMEREERD